jgi:hypothetical protein
LIENIDRSGEALLLGVRAGGGEILAVGEQEECSDSYISMLEQEGSVSS